MTTPWSIAVDLSWDGSGRLDGLIFPNGISSDFIYDPVRGLLSELARASSLVRVCFDDTGIGDCRGASPDGSVIATARVERYQFQGPATNTGAGAPWGQTISDSVFTGGTKFVDPVDGKKRSLSPKRHVAFVTNEPANEATCGFSTSPRRGCGFAGTALAEGRPERASCRDDDDDDDDDDCDD